MMAVDRCDFQVPPTAPGWYGIDPHRDRKQAVLWHGADWAEYPRRAYARSMKAFGTEEALACRAGFLFVDVQ